MPDFKKIMDFVNSSYNKNRVEHDFSLYTIYNGDLKQKITQTLRQEFEDPDTIKELENRIVPINITKKIADALGKTYLNEPNREPVKEDNKDQELIDLYSKSWNIDVFMDMSNKFFKLTKHNLLSPYIDANGVPRLRVLPSHTVTLFSDDPINPEKMTAVVVHVKVCDNTKDSRYAYWDKNTHVILDGEGVIVASEMVDMENNEMINPYAEIPFIHVTQQRELLYPIPSNDILSVQMAVCLLLSDCALAQKYLSWGTLVLSGVEGDQKIKVGPKAVITLPLDREGNKPDANYIQPKLNSDEVIKLVDNLIEKVLTTNNLTAGSVIGGLQVSKSASGISKQLDKLESTEDREEQQKYFVDAERKLWSLFAKNMLPYWVESRKISQDFIGAFSNDFQIQVTFPSIKPSISSLDKLNEIKLKLELGLTSKFTAIKEANPELDDQQVEQIILDIAKESAEANKNMLGDIFETQTTEPSN